MLCWGDLMDVRSGNAQIFTKTLVSVNFDPNAPKKWANTNAQNKTGFWSSRYIYIYINAYSSHFPSIVLQHWSPSRFSRLSFFKFHVMWQVLAIFWYIIYITYIIFFKIILYYVIYIYIHIYIYIVRSTQKHPKMEAGNGLPIVRHQGGARLISSSLATWFSRDEVTYLGP